MAKILIVEDDSALSETLQAWLEAASHRVDVVSNGIKALDYLQQYEYDLVILDWQLPGRDGIEVCRDYRAGGGDAYIIMLTAQSSPENKECGLDMGADDYVTKPFNSKELAARIRALLRRPPTIKDEAITISDLYLDTKTHQAMVAGQQLKLMPQEFALLEFLVRHPREVYSVEALLGRVWASDAEVGLQSVYTCMNRLRKKLKSAGHQDFIETVHGVGYKFVPPN